MYQKIKPVPSAERLRKILPVPEHIQAMRQVALSKIRDIISGEDKRKLVIIGPCSADDPAAVCDYAERLAAVAEKIKDAVYVIMRVHTGKPRTFGEGYMGMLHTPDISNGVTDISAGLEAARKLHLRVAENSGLFTSDELLYTSCAEYFSDIAAYLTVGARSAEDPIHRFAASAVDIPVGIKNPASGNVYALSGSVHAAQIPNEFLYDGYQVRSIGNKYAHAVLRGATDLYGNCIPNHGVEYVKKYVEAHSRLGSGCSSVIIDAGHANSGKNHVKQIDIVKEAVEICASDKEYAAAVKGFMIESYISDGSQALNGGAYGMSVTDPCLGWESSENLLLDIADKLS